MTDNEITVFAKTTFRDQERSFGIKTDDRRRHIYIVGKTGMGKTVMLENMAIQDIQAGRGVGIVDPHGEFAERMLDFVPKNRTKDVIYFNPADLNYPIAFNVIEKVDPEFRHLIASGLMGVFKKIWPDVWSARMEYILHNSILALLECPDSTLLGINRILADKNYREKVVENITDPAVKSFWTNEFAKYPDRFREEAVAPIQNKVGQFISAPLIRNIIGQKISTIDFRKLMDEGKILIVNLSKGRIGEDASHLLGALVVTKLQMAAMTRVDVPEEERRDFYLYVDEFQNFATEAFANILSEARKYHLCLILAHQYIAQIEEMTEKGRSTKVRDAVFGNVGTIISFRIGAGDAEFLEKEFLPEFMADDLVNLAKYNIYLKLMIDGVASRSFSAITLAPFTKVKKSYKEEIIKFSQEHYGTNREEIEKEIAKWHELIELEREAKTKPYEAVCDRCGKETRVSFKPDPRIGPVYCPDCLKIAREEEGKVLTPEKERVKEPEPPVVNEVEPPVVSHAEPKKETISLKEAVKKEPTSIRKKRKEVDIPELRKVLGKSLKEAGKEEPGLKEK